MSLVDEVLNKAVMEEIIISPSGGVTLTDFSRYY
jgi:hypothetical protein